MNLREFSFEVMGGPVVSFNPEIARMLGSVNAGIVLCQALYLQGDNEDKEWDYTQADWEASTSLGKKAVANAVEKLKELGLIEVRLGGVPARNFYRVQGDKLIQCIEEYTGVPLMPAVPEGASQSPPRGTASSAQRALPSIKSLKEFKEGQSVPSCETTETDTLYQAGKKGRKPPSGKKSKGVDTSLMTFRAEQEAAVDIALEGFTPGAENSAKRIGALWWALCHGAGVEFSESFTAKELGMLKNMAKKAGGFEIKALLEAVIPRWYQFTEYAKAALGEATAPQQPNIGYLLRHTTVAQTWLYGAPEPSGGTSTQSAQKKGVITPPKKKKLEAG